MKKEIDEADNLRRRVWFNAYDEYWYKHIKPISDEFLVLKTISPKEYIRRADEVALAAGIYARRKVDEMEITI